MKLKYIDSLRGLAILAVIIVHTSQWGDSIYTKGNTLYYDFVNRIFEQGARGVQLFYVVSAFTLFLSYQERKNKDKYPSLSFFIRRIFRVVPLYYLGIVFFGYIDGYLSGQPKQFDNLSLVSNVFLMNSLYPGNIIVPGGWTISVEMLFYIALPLFLFKYINNTNKAVLITCIAMIINIIYNYLFFKAFNYDQHLEYFRFCSFPNQMAIFGFGIIAFFITVKKDYKIEPSILLLISLLIILQLTLRSFIPTHVLFGLGFLFLLVGASKIEIFNWQPLVYLGKISYSAYFVHFAVLYWLNHFNFIDFWPTSSKIDALFNLGIRFVVVLFFVVSISATLYHFFELPMQKIGKNLILRVNRWEKR